MWASGRKVFINQLLIVKSKQLFLFTVSVKFAMFCPNLKPKSKWENLLFQCFLMPCFLKQRDKNTVVCCCNWQPKSVCMRAEVTSWRDGFWEPVPWIRVSIHRGSHIAAQAGLGVCDSIRHKFSHPDLQTIGMGLKTGISKQLQHFMNGGSVIIRN